MGDMVRVLLAGLSLIALLWTHMDQRRKPDEELEFTPPANH